MDPKADIIYEKLDKLRQAHIAERKLTPLAANSYSIAYLEGVSDVLMSLKDVL